MNQLFFWENFISDYFFFENLAGCRSRKRDLLACFETSRVNGKGADREPSKNVFKTEFCYYLSLMKCIATFLLFGILLAGKLNAQCCSYILNMHDSYGDGWNGGSVKVYINGTLNGTYLANNYLSVVSFQVCTGDTLELVYTAGAYENENSYQLYDAAWNLLFDDGPDPLTGNVFSAYGNCSTLPVTGSNPCTAMPIDTGQCITVSNVGFLGSGLNPGCANYQGGDYWFQMQVPPSGNVSLETDSGSLTDTGLAVWTDSTCINVHSLACDDDAGNGYFSFLMLFDLVPGSTIYIQVFGYGGGTGTFQLCANDLGTVAFDSSEIPIVLINTLNQTIVPETKINALMDVKFNGAGNITYVNGPANQYSGNIGIEIRGATSAGYPQPPYGIETRTSAGANNNVSLLGMPAENDWVLLSHYNDRSLMRNAIAFKLFGEMAHYSVRSSLCEVLIDSSYKGIYLFAEKIKRDNGRVDIAKLNSWDNAGDELTGGYILQQNYWDANNSFQSNYSPIDHPGFDVHFVYQYPEPDSITPAQKNYIAAFVDSLEDALYGINFADTALGYRKYLDTKSFIDYFIVNELARNADGFKKSVFFHKDKYSNGGKLKAGPVWDFDWAWKNLFGCNIYQNNTGEGWAHHVNDCPTDNYSTGWYIRLLQDTNFTNELRCNYESYRQTILDTAYIFSYMDSIKNSVQNAQLRHFLRWPILGMSGPAPEMNPVAQTYSAEIDTLKKWIGIRLQWLDNNIPGNCMVNPTKLAESGKSGELKFLPNPSSGLFEVIGKIQSSGAVTLSIFDLAGKEIESRLLNNGEQRFEISLDTKGVFFYTIRGNEGLLQQGKLICY